MKRILSTGDPEKDAKLVSEALGQSNPRTKDEDKEWLKQANEQQLTENRNALVDTPHNEGEVLLVLPDEKDVQETEKKSLPTPATTQVSISPPMEKKVS